MALLDHNDNKPFHVSVEDDESQEKEDLSQNEALSQQPKRKPNGTYSCASITLFPKQYHVQCQLNGMLTFLFVTNYLSNFQLKITSRRKTWICHKMKDCLSNPNKARWEKREVRFSG